MRHLRRRRWQLRGGSCWRRHRWYRRGRCDGWHHHWRRIRASLRVSTAWTDRGRRVLRSGRKRRYERHRAGAAKPRRIVIVAVFFLLVVIVLPVFACSRASVLRTYGSLLHRSEATRMDFHTHSASRSRRGSVWWASRAAHCHCRFAIVATSHRKYIDM